MRDGAGTREGIAAPGGFEASLAADGPPPGASAALAALWWAGRDGLGATGPGWERAHALAQDADHEAEEGEGERRDPDAAWVHAHLHRVEGDLGNAAYWYARAGRPAAIGPLAQEWRAIAAALAASPTAP